MATKDLHHNVKVTPAIDPAAAKTGNGVTTSATIDTQGFESLEFVLQSGVITDGTFTPALYEGSLSDMSDETVVAAADLLGTIAGATFAATDDSKTKKLGYRGTKRYVRTKVTQAGATTGGYISAVAVQAHAHSAPVA